MIRFQITGWQSISLLHLPADRHQSPYDHSRFWPLSASNSVSATIPAVREAYHTLLWTTALGWFDDDDGDQVGAAVTAFPASSNDYAAGRPREISGRRTMRSLA
ncbi:hypothetical protein RP20_CCG015731 [Aedes albopictus]|nr:hypothetical protein RP20_CCG015731 [Aedes albopictus]